MDDMKGESHRQRRGSSANRGAVSLGKAPAAPEVAKFLQGPQPRGFELARALRIFFELLHGFRALHFVGPCVTVFGSARFARASSALRARAGDRRRAWPGRASR